MKINIVLEAGLSALALASCATRRIRLASLPVSPYAVHPLRIADQLLTL